MTVIDGHGTREDAWLPHLHSLPSWDLTPRPDRVVVLAPHPDDEVLGVGGLLALLQQVGSRIELLAVTDGEASNPGGSIGPDDLAVLRRAETAQALSALGLDATVTHLHLPDGGDAALEQPVFDALTLHPGDLLLAPWEHDGHPDHEAVGRAARRAAERDGARLLAYPVWAWHWDTPGAGQLPLHRAARVELPPEIRVAKARAVDAFITQIRPLGPLAQDAPVLPAHVLARFARPFEVVLP